MSESDTTVVVDKLVADGILRKRESERILQAATFLDGKNATTKRPNKRTLQKARLLRGDISVASFLAGPRHKAVVLGILAAVGAAVMVFLFRNPDLWMISPTAIFRYGAFVVPGMLIGWGLGAVIEYWYLRWIARRLAGKV